MLTTVDVQQMHLHKGEVDQGTSVGHGHRHDELLAKSAPHDRGGLIIPSFDHGAGHTVFDTACVNADANTIATAGPECADACERVPDIGSPRQLGRP